MADFFDTSAQADLDLLHSSIREHPELDNMVDKVEFEILQFYSQRENDHWDNYWDFFKYEKGAPTSTEILVRLVGYDQDTPTNSEADLQEALRRTIAEVASWALRNYSNSPGAHNVTLGRFSTGSGGLSDLPTVNDWPDNWNRFLKNFDAKIPKYGI